MANQSELLKRVTIIPGLCNGKPTIRGLRFPVSEILELLASGLTVQKIIKQHPALQKEDIEASLLYASLKMNNTRIIHAA